MGMIIIYIRGVWIKLRSLTTSWVKSGDEVKISKDGEVVVLDRLKVRVLSYTSNQLMCQPLFYLAGDYESMIYSSFCHCICLKYLS